MIDELIKSFIEQNWQTFGGSKFSYFSAFIWFYITVNWILYF